MRNFQDTLFMYFDSYFSVTFDHQCQIFTYAEETRH